MATAGTLPPVWASTPESASTPFSASTPLTLGTAGVADGATEMEDGKVVYESTDDDVWNKGGDYKCVFDCKWSYNVVKKEINESEF
jgi:hypothetical protein